VIKEEKDDDEDEAYELHKRHLPLSQERPYRNNNSCENVIIDKDEKKRALSKP